MMKSSLLCLVIGILVHKVVHSNPITGLVQNVRCEARVDVGFIVDSSGSLKSEYKKEKSFVKSLAGRFGLSAKGSHAGVVLFSDNAELRVTLAEKNTVAEFNSAVDSLPLLGATTRLDKALQVAYDKLFQPKNGMRLDVPQVLFVLTDGEQTKADGSVSPAQAIVPFHESDIKVVVIGIGSRINKNELKSMVKSDKDVYFAKNFDELISSKFVDDITSASCQKAEKCKSKVDVGFIMDLSGSIGNDHVKEKEFVKALADTFSISQDESRVAVITFNSKAAINIRFSDLKTAADFKFAVDNLPRPRGRTRIDIALKLARDELLQSKNGARVNVPKLLVLLTDGTQTKTVDAVDPAIVAAELRQLGVRLVVIGIGKNVNTQELLHIAEQKSNLYQASSFDELKSPAFVASISKTGCKLSEKPFKCDAAVDIGFIFDPVDASKSMLFQQKQLLKSIVNSFTTSSQASRFGLIASNVLSDIIKFKDYQRSVDFSMAVDLLTSSPLNVMNLDKAIEGAYTNLFDPFNGARKETPRLLIILSARKSSSIANPALLSKAISPFQEDGTKVLVVTTGAAVNNPLLTSLASSPNDFFVTERVEDLSKISFQTKVAESACRVTVPKCKNIANIGFIVDSSGSLRRDYGKEKEFVKQLVESFEISQAGSRAGVVTFSNDAKLSIAMNQHTSVKDFNKAVDDEPLMGYTTRIDKALQLAKERLMVGARSDAPRIVFLLTDGSQTASADAIDPVIVAKRLREDGIQLIVIGIGKKIKVAELQAIAGNNANLYFAKDFDELKSRSFVQKVSNAVCDKAEETPVCKEVADVGFIVDSSGSQKDDFSKEKDLIKSVASSLDISSAGSRVSVVIFGDTAELSVRFSDHTNYKSFESAVDSLKLVKATTRIDRALSIAYDKMFNERNGMRVQVPKVLILLTDGTQTNAADAIAPAHAVARFHDAGIKLIVIGIGSNVIVDDLKRMVKSEGNLFRAAGFEQLKSDRFVKSIISTTCTQISVTPCDHIADIGFVVDSSGSLRNDYGKEKAFVKTLSDIFEISADRSRAGIVTFSNIAELSAKLSDHVSGSEFKAAVDRLRFMGSTTRIDKALKVAKDQLLLRSNGARAKVAKILIVLTDGVQTQDSDAVNPETIAKVIRDSGVTVFVVGIGSKVEISALARIAGDRSRLFLAKNFDQLNSAAFLKKAATTICSHSVIEVPGVTCQARADVGFIIDSSGSVRREYGKEKSFVKSLAYRFGLSAKGSHAGAVIFSHKAEVKVTFAEKNSITEFNDAIDNLPLLGYTTRIDKALRVAYNDLFQVRNGMRLGVPKVVFVLTDGKQTNEYGAVSPATAILPFHESDMKVIVIGVGSSVSKNELRSMTKSEKDVYFAKNFDELMSSEFVDKVIALSCQKADKCKSKVDVGFIVDSSGSIGSDYVKEKEFVKALADTFSISKDESRVAVITFNSKAAINVRFSDLKTAADFKFAVDNLPRPRGKTRIDIALKLARDELLKSKNGARVNVPKLLVLLTDGTQTRTADAVDPAIVAAELRQLGVRLVVIGIGKNVNTKELLHMAGQKSNFYQASNFDELKSYAFVESVSKAGCKLSVRPFKCNATVDIGFIIDPVDASLTTLLQQRLFLKSIAKSFASSSHCSRFGLIATEQLSDMIKFKDHTRASDFSMAVDQLASSGISTIKLDQALDRAYKSLFNPNNGARKDVPRVLIVLSARKSSSIANPTLLSNAINLFHDHKIKVLVVSIGPGANNPHLKSLASNPNDFYEAQREEDLSRISLQTAVADSTCRATVAKCKHVANIGFIVDSSGSLRRDYGKEKEFVKQLAESFEISEAGSRAGMVTFSHEPKLCFTMNQHRSLKEFNEAVDKEPLMGYTTWINKALLLAKEQLMVGARSDAPRIVFLLTDGSQTKSSNAKDPTPNPAIVAKQLREEGVQLIVIGIGKKVKVAELQAIAGNNANLYFAKDFDELKSRDFVQRISKASCENATQVVSQIRCRARADVGFIVDSSGSLRREYGKEKLFVKSLAYRFGLSAEGCHAGVVRFSHKAEVRMRFAEKNSVTEFNNDIDNMPLWGYTTRIDEALRVAYNDLFQVKYGMRMGVSKVVFVLTDGKQTNAVGAVSPAKAILPFHKSNIKVVVIGIGSRINKNELKSMVKSEKDVYFAKNFDELISSKFVDDITAASCQTVAGKFQLLVASEAFEVFKLFCHQSKKASEASNSNALFFLLFGLKG